MVHFFIYMYLVFYATLLWFATGPLKCNDDEFRCRFTERCLPRHLMNTKYDIHNNRFKFGCRRNESIILPCRKETGAYVPWPFLMQERTQ